MFHGGEDVQVKLWLTLSLCMYVCMCMGESYAAFIARRAAAAAVSGMRERYRYIECLEGGRGRAFTRRSRGCATLRLLFDVDCHHPRRRRRELRAREK